MRLSLAARDVRASRPTAIIVHGLEGSSNSQYVVGNSNKLWQSGCNIIRMNMRNCGGTEALTPTLYHSGLSGDVLVVMRFFIEQYGLESISLVGYSMGGNLVLKLAGELGSTIPPQLHSVIGVSPAVDLAPSADALHAPQNRLYEMKFLHALLRRFRRKAALFPGVYDANRTVGYARSESSTTASPRSIPALPERMTTTIGRPLRACSIGLPFLR